MSANSVAPPEPSTAAGTTAGGGQAAHEARRRYVPERGLHQTEDDSIVARLPLALPEQKTEVNARHFD